MDKGRVGEESKGKKKDGRPLTGDGGSSKQRQRWQYVETEAEVCGDRECE
jgi:hypothetical protein